ncbi:glycosyltransferase family 2 protein [Dyadobacter jiangsuensis]|uniref:Glycosyl transferase family 2 n=1 Tax=Dyadobacter jiangsuensis TaxID=1591085 RepID=A0A2P8FIH1_9BACT|nr:glycosyltransferase family 2 protein [Dyadobacter jiangsuensis]PSL21511.1 glycosyl transferase family 2 [Dyadobacter jiangsuensis]
MDNTELEFQMPVFILHPDGVRLDEIRAQFEDRSEFTQFYVPLNGQQVNAQSLWAGITEAAKIAAQNEDDVFVICSERHRFSEHYAPATFLDKIVECRKRGSEAIFFNIGAFDQIVPLTSTIFWINHLICFDFVVVFRELLDRILASELDAGDRVEDKISALTDYMHVVYPFISNPDEKSVPGGGLLERIRRGTKQRFELIKFVKERFLPDYDGKKASELAELSNTYVREYPNYIGAIEHFLSMGKATVSDVKFISHLGTATSAQRVNRIVVLVPFYNVENYLDECINSIVNQDYSDFTVIFLDDSSTDNSISKIPDLPNCRLITSTQRSYALANIYMGLCSFDFKDEDIVVIVDGDDFLRHNQVFKKINYIYEHEQCLLTYGQYCSTTNQLGHCRAYNEEEFGNLRELDWRASHLKTFKYSLFSRFVKLDPEVNSFRNSTGSFFEMTYDVALMTPLMEIAGFEKIYFNADIVYVYRIHENNDAVRDIALQNSIATEIKFRKSLAALN